MLTPSQPVENNSEKDQEEQTEGKRQLAKKRNNSRGKEITAEEKRQQRNSYQYRGYSEEDEEPRLSR